MRAEPGVAGIKRADLEVTGMGVESGVAGMMERAVLEWTEMGVETEAALQACNGENRPLCL